uniref:Uncharacterized protein n=1 Tax=Rhizophora mucronata TaxID=61149 RepID=A0A2P2NPW1_RHIMU
MLPNWALTECFARYTLSSNQSRKARIFSVSLDYIKNSLD